MKVLLSAYACNPSKGSESANGYYWATNLACLGFEVWCLTSEKNKKVLEDEEGLPTNLNFIYVTLPTILKQFPSHFQLGMYGSYNIWQWKAYKEAKKLHKHLSFDLVHHVTWGSVQQGSFLYKLKIPLIFGPTGGGQYAPPSFRNYFLHHWAREVKREKVSLLLQKFNPACRNMIKNTRVALSTNRETMELMKNLGAKKVDLVLDAALPLSFFPKKEPIKITNGDSLRLLWVGRFMPRKGILLVLDVMARLKEFPGIKLTVVGDGEMKQQFLEKMKTHALDEQVTWVGKVPYSEVRAIYAQHDAFFFTSLRDSSPAQLIEAMAYGLPVITLNLHGQGLIVDETRGLKCEAVDPDKTIELLTEAILKLYHSPKLLQKLSKGAYQFALQQVWDYKVKIITDKYYH